MFEKFKDKLARNVARLEERKELLELRAHVEVLEKSHDIMLDELRKVLNDEEVKILELSTQRYAFGLREGYETGFTDGVYQYQIGLVKKLAEQGVHVDIEELF